MALIFHWKSFVFAALCCCACTLFPWACLASPSHDLVVHDIDVTAIMLDNNRIIPPDVLQEMTASYLNRRVSYLELELLRNNLTLWLVNNGYITSGVVVPDQEIGGGTVHLAVMEGKLTSVKVTGTRSFAPGYFADRIMRAAGPPLKIASLQETFQVLQQDPRVNAVNAELSAGALPGESGLNVRVSETSPWQVALATSNDNPPSIGSYHGDVNVAHRNVTGWGDILDGRFGGSEGGYDAGLHYARPVTAADTLAEIYFRRSDYKVIDPVFKPLDIESTSTTYGARISHPLLRSVRREVRPSLSAEYRESKNYLLGQGFSFTPGENDGVSRLSVARLGLEWVERDDASVLVGSSTLSTGITGDGFLSWLGRLLWMRRTGLLASRVNLRGEIHLADTMLPPMEKYTLGGLNSVRGYRKNLLVVDNGVNGSVEWLFPLLHDTAGAELLSLAPFIDYGRGWDNGPVTFKKELAGAGIGVRCAWKGISLDLFYGYALIDSGSNTGDPQDHGLHFLVVWNVL